MFYLITVKQHGNLNKTRRFLESAKNKNYKTIADAYGAKGVELLQANTPTLTGYTADLWRYEVEDVDGKISIAWFNDNQADGEGPPVAILLQYGHGTRNGGYFEGIDFINPIMQPLFNDFVEEIWSDMAKG